MPQLGLGGAIAAAAFPCHGARYARPWRFRMGEGKQLQSFGLHLRPDPVDTVRGGKATSYRLSADHYPPSLSPITCPTLLMRGSEIFLPDPAASGLLAHIGQADLRTITGAGHWLHHDKLDDVLLELRPFLGISG